MRPLEETMIDLAFVLLIVFFFALSFLILKGLEKIKG
jgi:preprotein translocase subunit SecE